MNKLKKGLSSNKKIDANKIEKFAKDLSSQLEENEKIIRLSISLNAALHKKLKTFCAIEGTNIQNVVSALIVEFLQDNESLKL